MTYSTGKSRYSVTQMQERERRSSPILSPFAMAAAELIGFKGPIQNGGSHLETSCTGVVTLLKEEH